MCARQLQREGRLRGQRGRGDRDEQHRPRARAARDSGIELVRCPVGDKYVMEEMLRARPRRSAASSRATSSSPTTCSPATACARRSTCCGRWWRPGATLADLADDLVDYPQVLLNVRVAREDRSAGRCRRGRRHRRVEARSRARAGCSCATRAPSRCCASCSRGRIEGEIERLGARKSSTECGEASARRRRPIAAPADGPPLRQRQQGRHAAQLARRRDPARARRRATSASRPASPASPCIPAPTSATSPRRTCARSPRELRGPAAAVEFNIEGDPRPDLIDLVQEVRPDQCTLVPVRAGRDHEPGRLDRPTRRARRCERIVAATEGRRHARQPVRRPGAATRSGWAAGARRRSRRALHRAVRARLRARERRRPSASFAVYARRPRRRARSLGPGRERRPRSRPGQPARCSARCRTSTRSRSATRSSATRLFVGLDDRRARVPGRARGRDRRRGSPACRAGGRARGTRCYDS